MNTNTVLLLLLLVMAPVDSVYANPQCIYLKGDDRNYCNALLSNSSIYCYYIKDRRTQILCKAQVRRQSNGR